MTKETTDKMKKQVAYNKNGMRRTENIKDTLVREVRHVVF